MKITRRQLLIASLTGLGSLGLFKLTEQLVPTAKPIPGELLGASSSLGHQLRQGGFPKPAQTLKTDLVIVGGGISGLAAGYRLNKAGFKDFVLLDLEKNTGGNAAHGKNAVSAYPWGAHYVPLLTEEAGCVRKLFEELGIITGYGEQGLPIYNEFYLCADPNERLFKLGRWQDGLVPTLGINKDDEAQYKRFFALMADYKKHKGKDGKTAFAIPVDKSSQDAELLALDALTMDEWLKQQGFTAEPLRWYVNYCCRDDFGTTLNETSAWAGIHYFAARSGQAANIDSDSVVTWPEGNGWLASALAKPLANQIKTSALCFSVEESQTGVKVDCFDVASQQTIRYEAKAAIIATPRFIAQRLLKSKLTADGFSYAPWAVANITLSKMPQGKGVALSWDNVIYNSELLGYVTATHQIPEMHPIATVLTYYWPLSHDTPVAARKQALARTYQEWQSLFLKELLHVHPELEGHVERVDVWLWGHGMIRPTRNFIWGPERKAALVQQPPVFTAHSDMSGISIFEEAYTHGVRAAEHALAHLAVPYQTEL